MNWWQITICVFGAAGVVGYLLHGVIYAKLLEKWNDNPIQYLKSPRGHKKRVGELRKRYELGWVAIPMAMAQPLIFLALLLSQYSLIKHGVDTNLNYVRYVFCTITFCAACYWIGLYLARIRLAKCCLKEVTGEVSYENLEALERKWSSTDVS